MTEGDVAIGLFMTCLLSKAVQKSMALSLTHVA